MTCQTCAHWSPKANREMAKVRLAMCALGTRWTFFPSHAGCERHVPAPAAVIEARVKWLARAK